MVLGRTQSKGWNGDMVQMRPAWALAVWGVPRAGRWTPHRYGSSWGRAAELQGRQHPGSWVPYCWGAMSIKGFWTPKAVMKMLTTTMMNTRPVARLLRKSSLACLAGLLRSYLTRKMSSTPRQSAARGRWR